MAGCPSLVKVWDHVMPVRNHTTTFPIGSLTPMMRSMVISAHGHYGNTKTIDGARSRFDDHVSGKAICDVNLRTTVRYLMLQ